MITVCKGNLSVDGTKREITADLIIIFIGLIKEDLCTAITAALGVVLSEGGSVLDDKNN